MGIKEIPNCIVIDEKNLIFLNKYSKAERVNYVFHPKINNKDTFILINDAVIVKAKINSLLNEYIIHAELIEPYKEKIDRAFIIL